MLVKSLANTHVNFLLLRLIQGYTKKMNAALEKMAAAMDDRIMRIARSRLIHPLVALGTV